MTATKHQRAAALSTAALLTTLLTVLAPGGTSVAGPPAARDLAAPDRWVATAYGQGAIRVTKAAGARIHLTFTGNRGDLVRLENRGRVVTGARLNASLGARRLGRTVAAEDYPMWRLPASGQFTLTLRSHGQLAKLQLVKLRTARLAPGRKVTLPSRRGYGWWLTATMPRKGAWAARLDGAQDVRWRSVHVGGDTSETYLASSEPYLATQAVALVAGSPPLTQSGDSLRNATKAPVRAGRPVHLYTTGGGSARLLEGRAVIGQLDGGSKRVGPSGLLVSTVELPARTLVREVARVAGDAPAEGVRSRVLDVAGPTSFPSALFTDEGGPQTVVTLAGEAVGPRFSYGLRSTRTLGTLPAPLEGEPPVTTSFVVEASGQWVVARLAPTDHRQRVAVASSTFEDWRLTFHPTYLIFCGVRSGLGCGDNFGATLSPGEEHSMPTDAGTEKAPTFVLLRPTGADAGTVDVTVEHALY
jgi:hypothetical protein